MIADQFLQPVLQGLYGAADRPGWVILNWPDKVRFVQNSLQLKHPEVHPDILGVVYEDSPSDMTWWVGRLPERRRLKAVGQGFVRFIHEADWLENLGPWR